MDSDLAWVNGIGALDKADAMIWHADDFKRCIISGAIYHFTDSICLANE